MTGVPSEILLLVLARHDRTRTSDLGSSRAIPHKATLESIPVGRIRGVPHRADQGQHA